MKILLDECLPLDFRKSFPTHEAHTAEWAGFKGKQNGELLDCAEGAGYDVLLTLDQGFPYQQNLMSRKLFVIVLRSSSTQIQHLNQLVDSILAALDTVLPGEIIRLG